MEVTGTRSGASGMRRAPSSPSSAATASRCRRAPAGRRKSASPTWTRSAWTFTSSRPTSGSTTITSIHRWRWRRRGRPTTRSARWCAPAPSASPASAPCPCRTKASIAEMERVMTRLGLKGIEINDHVNGRTLDEPEFRPFFKAAEQTGAVIFFHQSMETLVTPRSRRYHLPNSIGNLVDRAVTFATLVHGGVMDECPELKIVLGHGGGYTCYGIGRMDHAWKVRSEARGHVREPPSAYLRRFYYDCIVYTEEALRYLIDTVGVDRVVFGTDWPYDMALDWPVSWVLGMKSLSQDEKEAILSKNLERLLSL